MDFQQVLAIYVALHAFAIVFPVALLVFASVTPGETT